MKLPINKILTMARDDYEKAWLETADMFIKKGRKFNLLPKGQAHPVNEFISSARLSMIELGFEEIILPMFVDEEDVYKEYGPEAALILDRLFYLAELPRPEIGVSQKKISIIQEIVPNFKEIDQLKEIFRRYKKGEIEADDLIEVMVEELQIKESQSTAIIEYAFPEFKELKPIPTKKTLRSHTTALWFIVLAELHKKRPLPLQYFLIGPKWRREQKIDATHLICSNTLSIAIMADEITLEDAKEIGRQIAQKIGFDEVKIETKVATSKYYAPQTEFEIFVQHPATKEWIEIGDGGFYSPVSLANFEIDQPVLNIGFGVERICMIKTGEVDIRNLVFPYFYSELVFSDKEIAELLRYEKEPITGRGKEIAKTFVKIAKDHQDDKSPVEIEIWNENTNNRHLIVTIWEKDENAQLIGKAGQNEIWVLNGNIICRSTETQEKDGVKSNLSFLEGIANYVGWKSEELISLNKEEHFSMRVKIPRHPSELNIFIDEKIMNYIHSRKKKINIRGPVFIGIDIKVE